MKKHAITSTVNNVQGNLRTLVYAPDGYRRPIANMSSSGVTQQCVNDGDYVVCVMPSDGKHMVNVSVHGSSAKLKNQVKVFKDFVSEDDAAFLKNEIPHVPVTDNWNGEDTLNNLAHSHGLHKFFAGIPDYSILSTIMGLDSDFSTPKVSVFDTSALGKSKVTKTKNVSDETILGVLKEVDNEYVSWLLHDKMSTTYRNFNWRAAEGMPDTLGVSCVLEDGKPVRFNDLIVWRGDDCEPEVVSVFDIVNNIVMRKTNFLSMPYVIDEDVTRIMYVLHGKGISSHADNVAWLYRRR